MQVFRRVSFIQSPRLLCAVSHGSATTWAGAEITQRSVGLFQNTTALQVRSVRCTPMRLEGGLLDDLDSLVGDLGIEDTTTESKPATGKEEASAKKSDVKTSRQGDGPVSKKPSALSVDDIKDMDMPQARSALDDLAEEKQVLMTAVEKELVDVTNLKQKQKEKLPRMHKEQTELGSQPRESSFPVSKGESLDNLQIFQGVNDTRSGDKGAKSLDPVVVTKVNHIAKLSLIGELLAVPTKIEKETRRTSGSVPRDFVSFGIKAGTDTFTVRCYGTPFLEYCRQALRAGDLLHIVGDLTFTTEGDVTNAIVKVEESGGTLTVVYGPPDPEVSSL